MAQLQQQLRWGALRRWPRPAAGVDRARLQGNRAGGYGDRASPGGRVHMPGLGNRAMPAGASCGAQGPGWHYLFISAIGEIASAYVIIAVSNRVKRMRNGNLLNN